LNHKAAQQSKKTGFGPPKNGNFEEILGKRGLELWYKGHQSVIKLFPAA
jgi:hypothetical protein